MTQFYCFTCDHYRDSNEQDHADYSGEHPVCGDCVMELEEQNNQWWAVENDDESWIRRQLDAS